jgi:hypothetical protein
MALPPEVGQFLSGPLASAGPFPLALRALLCDLRPRFLVKGAVGRGFRAVARNGRVLLASDLPLADLAGRTARVRLQTWHKAILPEDPPEPYGVLLCVRGEPRPDGDPCYLTRLERKAPFPEESHPDLILDVGGGMVLTFLPAETRPG